MQYMRPFNPYTEDIDMYLEEAKERHLFVPSQKNLKAFAARINAQNEAIVQRDEEARKNQSLKKRVEEDEKEEKKKNDYSLYLKKFDQKQYHHYVKEFDKKYKRGQYDPKYNKSTPTSYNLVPATYTGWEPRMWSANGIEVQPHFESNKYSFSNFSIVVDSISKASFPSSFSPIDTSWHNSSNANDITQVKFDVTDPYLASLAAAYKTFCLTGFSLQHLDSTDPFVKSLSNYFVYYWMSVLMRNPYSPPKDIQKYLLENHPIHKVWTKEFHQGQETPTWWMKRQPEYKQGKIRNARPSFGSAGRRYGQAGIDYEKVTFIGPRGDDDWKDLIPKTSKGFTKLGQKMFQQSLESLVFSILDAQAKTGWSITEQGAKSFQTQDVFRKLVQDTIIQHDVTITINNMKKAISDTNVSLNFALIPKTILIPSDMRLQTKIPGFNNILTLVNSNNMSFGLNKDINSRLQNPVKSKHDELLKDIGKNSSQSSDGNYTNRERVFLKKSDDFSIETEIIGGVAVGVLLRLLFWLV